MKPGSWFQALVGGTVGTVLMLVVVPAIKAGFEDSVPTSAWLEVADFRVEDAEPGISPTTWLLLTVNRSFVADLTATVRRVNGDGTLTSVCRGGGRDHYQPKSRAPDVVSLDRLLEAPGCRLAPARYLVTLAWEITTGAQLLRLVEAESNVFEVR